MTPPSDTETPSALDALRGKLMMAALPHVTFEGWSRAALEMAAADLGLEGADVDRAFPEGPIGTLDCFSAWADRQLEAEAAGWGGDPEWAEKGLRERVSALVRRRIEIVSPYKEAVSRGASFQALPQNAPTALKCLSRTVDTIWQAAGDRSADFSYYTKRMTLAGIYGATLLYWLTDNSEGNAETWRFLDRRLAGLRAFGELTRQCKSALAHMPDPFRILGSFRRPPGPSGR
ncbi:MAG: COQ9 family protein [Alphaproteobacteria bacterium]